MESSCVESWSGIRIVEFNSNNTELSIQKINFGPAYRNMSLMLMKNLCAIMRFKNKRNADEV